MKPRYSIGIDLGTTNCALAWTEIAGEGGEGGESAVQIASIPQLVNANEIAEEPLLPSFLYIPGERDFPADSIALPWNAKPLYVTGKLAQRRVRRGFPVALSSHLPRVGFLIRRLTAPRPCFPGKPPKASREFRRSLRPPNT